MNVFYLSKHPVECARQHCDQHAIKMPTEYAQLLSTAHRVLDGEQYVGTSKKGNKVKRWMHPDPVMEMGLMQASHVNNPISKWLRESSARYLWLYELYVALSFEYFHRYGRDHESYLRYAHLLERVPTNIGNDEWTEPPQSMPDQYRVEGDCVVAYRNFYNHDKSRFAKWVGKTHPGTVPAWYQPTVINA